MTKRKEQQGEPHEPMPHITPEMVHNTFRTLQKGGMLYYGEQGVYIPTEKGWKLLMKVNSNREELVAYGSAEITGSDFNSIRITKLERADGSVIGVKANKACADLNSEFKDNLRENKKVEITFEVGDVIDVVTAYSSAALKLSSKSDIEIRKDDFIGHETVAILADKSASELKRELVEKMKVSETKLKITLEIKS